MEEEFDSLMENGTWEYQKLSKGRKIIKKQVVVQIYGEVEDKIYMTHPLGFENLKEVGKICRLRNALYGL
jgi:hypothetical protein